MWAPTPEVLELPPTPTAPYQFAVTLTSVDAQGRPAPSGTYAASATAITHSAGVLGHLAREPLGHTPLRPLEFERELRTHPDKDFVDQLVHNLTLGCNIGYQGPQFPYTARNLQSAWISPEVVDNTIHSEKQAGRLEGPFPTPPLPNFRASGIGLVPKKDGRWRLIHHLSAPPGLSINDFIDPASFTLTYPTIDDAFSILIDLGPNTLMAKIDLRSAFRQCPVRPEDWNLLGLCWRGKFYFDKCLPFGLRSAPFLFDQVGRAIEWIARCKGVPHLVRYLDDFLTFGQAHTSECTTNKNTILNVCSTVNAPVNPDKVVDPTTSLEFLGIWLDTKTLRASIAAPKRQELLADLRQMLPRRTCTKREMLRLIGKLSFACKVVPAGRTFLRRLIDKSTEVKPLHHHLTLSEETRADLRWWLAFLPSWQGSSSIIQSVWAPPTQTQLYTDASASLGYGAYYRGHWFYGTWSTTTAAHSIAWKELYPIILAASTWGRGWRGQRILFHCDNQSVGDIWSKGSSGHADIMSLVRVLYFIAATLEFHVSIQHVPGVDNTLADALSRLQVDRFHQLCPSADPQPTVPLDPRHYESPSAVMFNIFNSLP